MSPVLVVGPRDRDSSSAFYPPAGGLTYGFHEPAARTWWQLPCVSLVFVGTIDPVGERL